MGAAQANARKALHALLVDFELCLQREYDALLHRNAELIESAVAEKQRLTTALGEASRLCDFDNRHQDGDPLAKREWAAIEEILARCAKANQTNGAAVQTSRNLASSLLDVLRGRSPRDKIYDARGRTGARSSLSQARDRV